MNIYTNLSDILPHLQVTKSRTSEVSSGLASGLKLNFCFSGRMGHVLIGEKLYEQCVLFMGKGVARNQLEQQEGISTMTPGKTAEDTNMVPAANMI